MRTFFGLLLGAALLPLAAVAQFLYPTNPPATVTLAWDPVAGAASYHLYFGVGSQQYTNMVSVVATSTTVTIQLVRGSTYYFAATTVDTNGLESLFSAEVSYRPPPLPPAPILRLSMSFGPGMQIDGSGGPGLAYSIDASSDLAAWSNLGTAVADSGGNFAFVDLAAASFQRRFYRARGT